MGTEHEKFGFRLADLAHPALRAGGRAARLDPRPAAGPARRFGGTPIPDADNIIGLKQGDAAISLEPAGQLELSGAPVETLHDTMAELEAHYDQVRSVSHDLHLGFMPLGFHPIATRAQMPWMPKSRYAIMRRYMPKVGTLGLDMMTRTCTVQVNLDYASEQDMLRKLRVSLLLQPLATALFANSPFTEGRPNGFLSYRAHVWTDTDNRPLRHSAGHVRAGLRLRALRRMAGEPRADVFRLPRWPLHRRCRRLVPRLHGGAAAQPGRSHRDGRRLRRSHHHGIHGCADQALPGDARRRCRAAPT